MDNKTNIPETKAKKEASVAFSGGSYALILTAIVLAIVIAVNLFVSALPSNVTKLDISSSKLYSITANTKVVVNSLEKDVDIYWIVQDEQEDAVIENLLSKYDSLSDHITVTKKNPDTYPTFAAQYTDESVTNNSLVVECGDKYRYIGYDDMYLSNANYSTGSYDSSFDGEGAITSAIDYVVSDDLPVLYRLEGHGEEELPESFATQIDRENMTLNSFSLLSVDEVPDDADCVLLYAPASDLSDKEAELLKDYVAGGGKLMVVAGPTMDTEFENLYSILAEYGVEAEEGIVVETERSAYAFSEPYILLPTIESDDITDSLIEANYYILMPIARGMTLGTTSQGEATALLTSTDTSYSKVAGFNITTYEKEEGDIDGAFALAVKVDDYSGGGIVWVSSSYFLEETYVEYSSGANLDFAMNALSSLIGESEAVAIRSKSLGYNYLTISDETSGLLTAVMVFILPLTVVAAGIIVVIDRRRKRHDG